MFRCIQKCYHGYTLYLVCDKLIRDYEMRYKEAKVCWREIIVKN